MLYVAYVFLSNGCGFRLRGFTTFDIHSRHGLIRSTSNLGSFLSSKTVDGYSSVLCIPKVLRAALFFFVGPFLWELQSKTVQIAAINMFI